eukprot:m.240392 g.240392  ORF g.240392 m.240392 type:complete len:540 (-) comp13660_c0_seq1:152-1771(-)
MEAGWPWRGPLYCAHGSVCSSQPLASEIGIRILQAGGNAADAAVAVAAALNVTEPCSTGLGGDCFCLFYDAAKQSVQGINASGRAPKDLSLEVLREHGIMGDRLPEVSIHTVTVPGAAAGWVDTLERFGTKTLQEVLAPAIKLAEDGFPVQPIAAHFWARGAHKLQDNANKFGAELLLDGQAPRAGEIMRNPTLAATLRALAAGGRDEFYKGRIAEAIVAAVRGQGGTMTLDDLAAHVNTFDNPISVNYRGYDIWEIPPNGQGITALLALNILSGFDLAALGHNSVEYLHVLIESLRQAFADAKWFIADPSRHKVPVEELLSVDYATSRRSLISQHTASVDPVHGSPVSSSDTVYFCVVDGQGNACSFINSNYCGFGTGIVPEGCGFTLQNRGANFSLQEGHPNVLQPGKRPYHTIIPSMITREGKLIAPFGVMGGFMQPQGHVQVACNIIDFGMDSQQALNSLRFCIDPESEGLSMISLEDGLSEEVVEGLRRKGHNVQVIKGHDRAVFGRGQVIVRKPSGVLECGTDPRSDGVPLGW